MSQSRYRELEASTNPHDRIQRCQIIHYSRRHPETGTKCYFLNYSPSFVGSKNFVQGEISDTPRWMKLSCAWKPELSKNTWESIARPVYTNDDLMAEVNKVPQLINNWMCTDCPEKYKQKVNTIHL